MTTIDERLRVIAGELIEAGITLPQACEEFERKYIDVGIEQTRGKEGRPNITQASKKLGVHRNTLHLKLRTMRTDEEVARTFALMQRRKRR